jgi:hypothetical protein
MCPPRNPPIPVTRTVAGAGSFKVEGIFNSSAGEGQGRILD